MAHTGFSWDVGNRDWTLQSLGGDSGCPGLRWGQGKGLLGKGSRNAGPCLVPKAGCSYPTQASSEHLRPVALRGSASGRSSWREWRHRPPGFFIDNPEITGGAEHRLNSSIGHHQEGGLKLTQQGSGVSPSQHGALQISSSTSDGNRYTVQCPLRRLGNPDPQPHNPRATLKLTGSRPLDCITPKKLPSSAFTLPSFP